MPSILETIAPESVSICRRTLPGKCKVASLDLIFNRSSIVRQFFDWKILIDLAADTGYQVCG
jgi:hypothetical protein